MSTLRASSQHPRDGGSGRRTPPWAVIAALTATLLPGCDSGGAGPVDPPDPPPPVPTTVKLTPESHTFTALGETLDLSAEVTDQYGTAMPNATVTWRSQATDIATVESTGARTARVAAVATGETSVVATAGAATASAGVRVEQVPASVESVAGNALGDFPPSEAVEVVARVQDRNGHPVSGIEVVFAVDEGDGTVAPDSSTTDADGLATTTWTLGTASPQTLSATAGPIAARFTAEVSPVPTTVALTPDSHTFAALGETHDLSAEITDQYGTAMPDATVTWRSEATDIATVESTGARTARVAAVATGETSVVATAGAATASATVAVEQVPASVETEGDDLRDLPPATTVRVSAVVRDRNGHSVSGASVAFLVNEGGGTVEPESVPTDAEGRAEANWTLGASGIQTLSATAGAVSARFSATLCGVPPVLDPGLELGRPRVLEPAEIGCGVSVEAPEAGAYYRFTLVGTSVDHRPNATVEISVTGNGGSGGPPRGFATANETPLVAGPSTDLHPGRQERDRRVLSWIARPDGPSPLPDLSGSVSGSRAEPPETRVFTRGSAGTLEDNCTVAERVTGVRLAYNDHIAIYADERLSPHQFVESAEAIVDYYGNFGAPVIRDYFGGVADRDGNGRILALIRDLDPWSRVVAVVWMGDLLSKEDCPASNEGELISIDDYYGYPGSIFRMTGVVVHEAKHVSSHHQLALRAKAGDKDLFDVRHPSWVEEGTAEIAREVSARLGWESIGGPPPGSTIRGSDARRPNGTQRDLWTPEAAGVRIVLNNYGNVVVLQPNSISEHDPYGAGWGFFRFLGDWIGGAATSRLGDAAMFKRLNDAATPVGVDGIQQVAGRTFEELMIDYAQAVSVTGTGAPQIAGVPRFSTYEMSGLNRGPFSPRLGNGRFPYPVTISGSGASAPLWRPLAESATFSGLIGPNGFRIHDFRAERAGDRATIRVDAPEHVRLVVVRIPDQATRNAWGSGRF